MKSDISSKVQTKGSPSKRHPKRLRKALKPLGIPENLPLSVILIPARLVNYFQAQEVEELGEILDAWEILGPEFFMNIPSMGGRSVNEFSALCEALINQDTKALAKWLPISPTKGGLSLITGLNQIIRDLDDHQKTMMISRLIERHTLDRSASKFQFTRERVRQIESTVLNRTYQLLKVFPDEYQQFRLAWEKSKAIKIPVGDRISSEDKTLATKMIQAVFDSHLDVAEQELQKRKSNPKVKHWLKVLSNHSDLHEGGVDMQFFLEEHVPKEDWEELCQSLVRGLIYLNPNTGKVVHKGHKLQELMKQRLAGNEVSLPKKRPANVNGTVPELTNRKQAKSASLPTSIPSPDPSAQATLLQIIRNAGIKGARKRAVIREDDLEARPDLLFKEAKAAIFIDNAFWHGHQKKHLKPKGHPKFWNTQITKNRDQASRLDRALKKSGWKVLRLSDHLIDPSNEGKILTKIKKILA